MIWLVVVACSGKDDPTIDSATGTSTSAEEPTRDADQDGWTRREGDCDDQDPTVHPGAADELYDGVDSDCAGDSDFDGDGDGADAEAYGGEDCDDGDAAIGPGEEETCNGVDDDCDGFTDDADRVFVGGEYWYEDADGDGFGTFFGATVRVCEPPGPGWSLDTTDCADDAATAYPGAPDVLCDGLDNDCDDTTHEVGAVTLDGVAAADLPSAIAAGAPGSVVALCEGGYAGPLSIGIELTVVGTYGAAVTVIDAGGAGSAVELTGGPVTLTGLTLTGGDAVEGGGLRVSTTAPVVLTDVIVTGNTATDGGGVWTGGAASLTLAASTVSDNYVVGEGGGLHFGDGAVVTLSDTVIEGNTSRLGGGIFAGRDVTIDGGGTTVVDGNDAGDRGGGLDADYGLVLSGIELTGNSGEAGGGASVADATITDVVFTDNLATLFSGGGLYVFIGTATLERVDFVANEADWGSALSLVLSDLTLTDSVVQENDTTWFGDCGAAELQDATLVSIGTDWGTGATDNVPDDLHLFWGMQVHNWFGVADFTCTDANLGSYGCE